MAINKTTVSKCGWLAALALLLVSAPVFATAQSGLLGGGSGEDSAEAVESSPESKRKKFKTHRDAFGFFLKSMLAEDLDAVIESGVLDLDAIAQAERTSEGMEIADKLYRMLNRTELVAVEDLPDLPSHVINWTYRQAPPEQSEDLVIHFSRFRDEGWRISERTIADVPRMWGLFGTLKPIKEYRESLALIPYLRLTLIESLPEALRGTNFLLENWQWVGLAILVFIAAVLDRIARYLLSLTLRRLAGRTRLEENEVVRFERPAGILVGALIFSWLLPVLDIKQDLRTFLDVAAGGLATVAGVWAAYRMVDVVCGYLVERARLTDNKFDDMLVPLLRRTLKIFVTIIGLIYLASLASGDLWGLVAGLSIGSLAVGFAARDSIENLFGTFTVLLDKPFQLGDWIVTDGLEGTVEEVGFRSTRIRTFYDSLISVPNRHFISTSVDNLGVRRYRRIKTVLSLTYDTPPEKVEAFCEGVREVLRQHPYTRKDYYHVYLNNFSAASLDILLYCFLECPDWGTELREKQRLYLDVLRVAENLSVNFAFPTQTIHVAKPEDMQHPDRPENDIQGTSRGRGVGRQVARDTLEPFGNQKPSPVGYDEAYFAEQVGPEGQP